MKTENRSMVMLVLSRRVIGGLLKKYIDDRPGMKAFLEYDYNNAKYNAQRYAPDIALVEIPERYGTPAADTLRFCEEIKGANRGCRIILLCPENNDTSVGECVQAKQQGRIDDFLFYDSTTYYLVSKLEAMLSVEKTQRGNLPKWLNTAN